MAIQSMPIHANFSIFYFHFSRFSRLSFSTFFQNRSIVMTRSTCKSIVLYIESNEYCEGLIQLNLNPFQYSFIQYILIKCIIFYLFKFYRCPTHSLHSSLYSSPRHDIREREGEV